MGEKDALGANARNQAAERRVNGIVFDAGGSMALERNDRRVFSILDTALEDGDRIIVPATALAQVIRNPARQVRLWRMIQFDKTEVIPLDGFAGSSRRRAARADEYIGHHRSHVVICAQTEAMRSSQATRSILNGLTQRSG